MDDMEQLQEENQSLREDNQSMSEEIAKLRAAAKTAGKAAIKKWERGKLPGEKLIKTDPETGKFEEIDKAEWDSLA